MTPIHLEMQVEMTSQSQIIMMLTIFTLFGIQQYISIILMTNCLIQIPHGILLKVLLQPLELDLTLVVENTPITMWKNGQQTLLD